MPTHYKHKLVLGLTLFALITGGLVGGNLVFDSDAAAQMPGGEMPPMPVPVISVEKKPVQIWKEFSARLSAVDYVEIRPQVSGLILEVHFQDGQIVNAGDLLYTIDPKPYEAAVAQAKADLAAAREDSSFAQKEMKRAEELMATGAISKQVYDQRVNALKVNRSGIASAEARLKSAEVDLDRASIEAPITGRISRPEITKGNLVNAANAPLLTTIVSEQEIYADFEVDEQTYLRFVRQNASSDIAMEQAIPVRMSMNKDETWYDGKIKSFDNKIDPSSGTIRARAVFANDDGALLPGMFARVQIGSASEDEKIAIPEKAIGTDQDRKFVYVVGQDNAATYREVKPGDAVSGNRIILSGLEVGDRVIIDGLMKIQPGMKVQPLSPEEAAQMKAAMMQGPPTEGEAPQEASPQEPAPDTISESTEQPDAQPQQ